MATATATFTFYGDTDAKFRAWGSTLSGLLASCFGWVKCADSGQIDWGTVLKPAVGNTKQGYEIWRFNDTLQATAPVYLRIDFGSGNNALNPCLWVQIGIGTDGAGNILAGGIDLGAVHNQSADNTPRTGYFSGAPGRGHFCLGLNPAIGVGQVYFGIERTKDSSGNDTGDGVIATWQLAAGVTPASWRQQYYQLGVGGPGFENRLGMLMPSVGSGVSGGNTAVYPQWVGGRGPFMSYGLNLFSYFVDDITAMVTIALTVYGAGHTYLPLGTVLGGCITGATANKSSLLMRYE